MFFSNISASHIVGGEMTYSYKGNHKYDVKLLLYIDCYNGSSSAIASDKNATIVVFDGSTNQVISNLCQSVTRNNPVRVSKSNYSCIKITPNACVDAYEYNYSFTLPPIVGGYYLSVQRCCRNSTINNINNPSTIGENIWTYINDTAKIGFNSSPIFNTLPPNFLCTNTPLEIDHSATDTDGDSLERAATCGMTRRDEHYRSVGSGRRSAVVVGRSAFPPTARGLPQQRQQQRRCRRGPVEERGLSERGRGRCVHLHGTVCSRVPLV